MNCLEHYFEILNKMKEAHFKPKRPKHLDLFRNNDAYIWYYPDSCEFIYDGYRLDPKIVQDYLNSGFIEYTGTHNFEGAKMARYSIRIVKKPISRYISKKMREQVMEIGGGKCKLCDTTESLEIDHIYPISRGGKTELKNLQVLCRSCNAKKHASIPKNHNNPEYF